MLNEEQIKKCETEFSEELKQEIQSVIGVCTIEPTIDQNELVLKISKLTNEYQILLKLQEKLNFLCVFIHFFCFYNCTHYLIYKCIHVVQCVILCKCCCFKKNTLKSHVCRSHAYNLLHTNKQIKSQNKTQIRFCNNYWWLESCHRTCQTCPKKRTRQIWIC